MRPFSLDRLLRDTPFIAQVLLVVGAVVLAFVALRFGLPSTPPPSSATPAWVPSATVTETAAPIHTPVPTFTSTVVRTSTPRPTPTARPSSTPANQVASEETPAPTYVIITREPTPANVLTAQADALTAVAWATRVGTPTPLPANWVTPIIVTATPTPANEAAAAAESVLATAAVLLVGTPTPTPPHLWVVTSTPTPLFIYLEDLAPVELIPPTPTALPPVLVGKIAFRSTRRGTAAVYIMDVDGDGVALLQDPWAYEFASLVQVSGTDGNGYVSPDGQFLVYDSGEPGSRQIWVMDASGGDPRNVSDNDFDEYDPIWLRSNASTPTPTPTSTPLPTSTPTVTPTPLPTFTPTATRRPPKPTRKPTPAI